ncbi:MAG: hypothetical protein WD556_08665 [Actinomycetota bacterium]
MATHAQPEFTPALDAARKRRIKLRDELYDVEQAISRPAPGRVESWTSNVITQLQKLRDAMDEHVYVTEEPEGLYDEVLDLSPRLAGKVRRLREEHPLILEQTDELIGRLRANAIGDEWPLEDVRDETQRLLGRIVRHRQRGADLVWEAYNLDIGGMD